MINSPSFLQHIKLEKRVKITTNFFTTTVYRVRRGQNSSKLCNHAWNSTSVKKVTLLGHIVFPVSGLTVKIYEALRQSLFLDTPISPSQLFLCKKNDSSNKFVGFCHVSFLNSEELSAASSFVDLCVTFCVENILFSILVYSQGKVDWEVLHASEFFIENSSQCLWVCKSRFSCLERECSIFFQTNYVEFVARFLRLICSIVYFPGIFS